MQKQATGEGWEEVRGTLSAAKPKQAKELLLQMLNENEIGDVVALGPHARRQMREDSRRIQVAGRDPEVDEILCPGPRRAEPLAGTVEKGAAAARLSQRQRLLGVC